MQRVRFQGFAGVFFRGTRKRSRARNVNGQRHEEHQDGRDARLDVYVMKEQPVKRLIDDV
jgi:hypothetical protein